MAFHLLNLLTNSMPERRFTIASGTKGFIDGYVDDPKNAGPNNLCPPSVNCEITKTGDAKTRGGIEKKDWDLSEANKNATSFHHDRFNITFFAAGTSVKYVDHNNSDAVYDTGITLTDGTVTRFAEYAGDVYLTNPTDGIHQIHVFRLNDSAADLGDGDVTIDQDGAGRLIAFSHDTSSFNIRIQGTNEGTISSVAAAGTVTLSGTLSQNYDDNAVGIVNADISSNRPKGSKIVFWKNRMYVFGVQSDTNTYGSENVDVGPNSVYASKFPTRSTLEDIIDFDISSTADIFLLGKAGRVTNAVAARDFLYFFTENSVHYIGTSDINTTNGATTPRELSDSQGNSMTYGCYNEDSAAYMANDQIIFMSPNRRIVRIVVSTSTGAATIFPDEGFDSPISNMMKLMNKTQPNALVFYHSGERRCYFQTKISNVPLTLKYNNEIGKWEPPDTNKIFNSYFEIDGDLYSTRLGDDTIYQVGTSTSDDGLEIETVMATGQFEFEDGRVTCFWDEVEVSGQISPVTTITVNSKVDSADAPNQTISGSGLFTSPGVFGSALGSISVGDTSLGGSADAEDESLGDFDARKGIYPSLGGDCQICLFSFGDGDQFVWSSYTLKARTLTESLLTLS